MEGDKLIDQDLISILSIDGRGIRGIITAVILNFLESELQKLDGPKVRIADYFNTISGTNTGGLMTAMLTCPNKTNRPLFTAKDIIEFYLNEFPRIYCPPRSHFWKLPYLERVITFLWGPKYDEEYLHNVVRKLLGERRLHDTLTNVVIVDYDIIFSSHEIKKSPSQDALLSDICIGAVATPGYLPTHYFEIIDHLGNIRKCRRSVVINSSTIAITETTRNVTGGTDNLGEARKHGQFLLLSIGTKISRDSLDQSLFMFIIDTLGAKDYYLQIQDDTSCGDLCSIGKATKENLLDLVKIGEDLLRKPVRKRNPKSGVLEPYHKETNADALVKFAKLLSEGKKRRLALNFMGEPGQYKKGKGHVNLSGTSTGVLSRYKKGKGRVSGLESLIYDSE